MATFRTLELAIEYYKNVEKLNIEGHLQDQLLRASSSIALNLAEGNSRPSVKERRRFFRFSHGSQQECKAIFRLLPSVDPKLEQQLDQLGAMIYRLIDSNLQEWRVKHERR